MPKITHITPHFAVTGALRPEDFPEAARLGFKAVLSNLPDGESSQYLTSAEEKVLAERAGLAFRHIPATKFDLFSDRVIDGTAAAARDVDGPILAHCASGARSAVAWAAAAALSQPADCVLAALKAAGFNLEGLRGELEALRTSEGKPPPALDAGCDGTAA